MYVIRTLWASIQGDPVFMRKLNGWLTIFWICNFPPVTLIYFLAPPMFAKISILYLALVSIYANVAGHLSAWQASRIEVMQSEQDVSTEVVDKLKEDPDISV